MRFEIPEVERCCFCFPLRLGLIVWGYLKLTVSLILLIMILINFIYKLRYHYYSEEIPYISSNIVSIGSLIADIVFHIIFAVGAHKKDPKKMELFSKFCICILVMYVLGLCYAIYIASEGYFFALFFALTIGTLFFTLIISQIYIMILIRSEVVKLKRASNFQFINHAADANMNVKIDLDSKTIN